MTKPLTARIEVFRPGTFTPMDGAPISYSAADLRAIADAYDPTTAPAPIVVGHPDLDAPAFGWVEGFEYDAAQQRLMAKLHEIEPAFADAVKAGRYKKVSMAFYRPDQDHNPVPGTWYPKHVGFLGAAAPAVSGLKNASFAAAAGVIFTAEFGQAGMQETVSILRAIREFFIEKFGADDADRVIPGYRLEWMTEISRKELSEAADDDDASARAFSAETTSSPGQGEMAAQVRAVFDAAFGQREADLAAREAQLAASEAARVHRDNVAFAATLVAEGRLLPASQDQLVALMDALPAVTVQFSEAAEATSARETLRQILTAQPQVVSFGAIDVPGEAGLSAPRFSADGRPVDPARMEIHQKAVEFQAAHPGTDYVAAVRAVS